jgi:NADH-quinone oxidoreductase subunit L
MGSLYTAARRKFYIDEIYLFITQRIVFNLVGRPSAWIDRNIVDGAMDLVATLTQKISRLVRGFQSGRVQDYAVYFFAGVLCFTVLVIYFMH